MEVLSASSHEGEGRLKTQPAEEIWTPGSPRLAAHTQSLACLAAGLWWHQSNAKVSWWGAGLGHVSRSEITEWTAKSSCVWARIPLACAQTPPRTGGQLPPAAVQQPSCKGGVFLRVSPAFKATREEKQAF